MPPGFMKATTAPPLLAGLADASCASAITSPSALSPAGFVDREMSPVIEPMTRFASGAESDFVLSAIAWTAASGMTVRVIGTFFAFAETTLPVELSTPRSTLVTTRPNDPAWVTSLPFLLQMYHWCVWPLSTTEMSLDNASTILSASPPAVLHAFTSACDDVSSPWWMTRTIAFTRCFFSSAAYVFAVAASSRKRRPATPVGVTMDGVPFSTSPMKPTLTPPTVWTEYGGKSVVVVGAGFAFLRRVVRHFAVFLCFAHAFFCFASATLYFLVAASCAFVGSTTTFAARYGNFAPG